MVVLDTHVWLWWTAAPDRLSRPAATAIEQAETIGVPAISCWEVAMLHAKGRVALDREPSRWVHQALLRRGVLAMPLTPPLAVAAAALGAEDFPGDPADRMIYASARDAGAPLVTKDARLREFDARGTLW